ncbi:histone-lysine N-methyltransferase NSD3 isoform X2 [Cherax quadricarinatus]|uniref:histone-lysine N-methyltransferase NSD3 isoform X2 n=1 Tax=Cherax quadricarinatus TaxID=27406 RepID=UPI0023782EC1|nr:histone-lysine N-methyltransferase NSD3-like isoform X2 [Cherax quadricarinatus]
MDDVSSGPGMGYNALYLTSEVSSALENMSQDPEVCNDVHYSRRPEDDGEVNIHQENSMENWISHDEISRDGEKICGVISNDDVRIGENWLEGREANEAVKSSAEEEDNFSEDEEDKFGDDDDEAKYSADDEDKFSTEEEAKYSAVDDDTNFTEETKSSGEEEYSVDGCKLITQEEGKYNEDLHDEWLETGGHVDGQVELRDTGWVRDTEFNSIIKDKKPWPSSSEDERHSSTESEAELTEDDQEQATSEVKVNFPSAPSISPSSKAARPQPVLCFDEYGNLTTAYHSPEISTVSEIQTYATEPAHHEPEIVSVPLQTSEKNSSYISEEYPEYSSCNGEIRTLTNKPKPNHEIEENVLSDQELKQAFKEEFMTAATSRYGRTRKRKTEDGFFFGTLNFNELRKITGGSPKKTKSLNSKNFSPEQKLKAVTKDERKSKHILGEVDEIITQNGAMEHKNSVIEAGIKNISTSQVQISETKDEAIPVQNVNVEQGDNSDKDLSKCISNNNDSQKDPQQKNDNTSDTGSGNDGFTEEPFTKEASAVSIETTESATSSGASVVSSTYDRRRRLSLRKRSEPSLGTRATETHSVVSDRLLRGRSDVSIIKRSLQPCDQVVPHRRSRKIHTNLEPPIYASNSTTDCQDEHQEISTVSQDEQQEIPTISQDEQLEISTVSQDKQQEIPTIPQDEQLEIPTPLREEPTTFKPSRRCKANVDELGPITKSGRVVHKPRLMDISDEDKRQKLSREQLRQSVALMNTSLDELRKLPRCQRSHTECQLKTLTYMKKNSGQKYERWMKAIEEAKTALLMDRYERIQKYALQKLESEAQDNNQMVIKSSYKSLSLGRVRNPVIEVKPEKRKRGRPRKHSKALPILKLLKSNGDSTDGEFSGFDENSFENNKERANMVSKLSKESDFASYAREHLENCMLENPGISEQTARSKLRWKWKKLSSSQTVRYKSKRKYGDKLVTDGSEVNILKRKLSSFEEREEYEETDALSTKRQKTDDDVAKLQITDDDKQQNVDDVSTKRQRTDDDVDSIRGVYKVVRNEKVCYRCEGVSDKSGADMVRCKGLCCGVFHLICLGLSSMPKRDFKCEECQTGHHMCFQCKMFGGIMQRCSVPFCGKFYHEECVQQWPQVSRQRQQERFICPRHVCHMCAANADDMGDPVARNPPFTRCLRCPTTYHTGEDCIAAGTEEVSQSHHICTKHLQLPKNGTHHVNVTWCFCCSKGGSLLLCDQCPAAFHADCMKITTPEGGYVCEDCENGKFPIYGDIVWVKLGLYRWWPGQVLHPRYIPDNIENLQHQQGMFCVHFFGSNDYYWVTRGRAFLYQEGDKGSRAQSSKTLEMQFRKALEEAAEAYRAQMAKKTQLEIRWSEKGNLKPPPYVRIDSNRPVGNVRLNKIDLAAVNRCDCDPNSENPCGSDEKCLNRMLMFECMREVCGAGDKCCNQRFQKRQYPSMCSFRTETRGWGLKTTQDIKKGEFVIEYVGELIDDEEFRRRILEMHEVKEENYYFLTIDKDIMIDAGPKGNLARFMNHSCQPNCETQKWTVGGDTRVGLFAIEDIPSGSELTFNYNLQCVGTEKKKCCCGASNCSGFIGVKVQKTEMSGPKRDKLSKQKRKRRRRGAKVSEDECFRCGGPGDLILCDVVACPKGYHLECLGLDKLPKGKWICPWHHCDECGQRSTRLNRCDFCPNSFCRQHLQGYIQHLHGIGSVCQDHNSEELETLRGQMEVTAVIENITQMPKKSKLENNTGISIKESSQCTINLSLPNVLECSNISSDHASSNNIYGDSLECNALSEAQDETELHSPQGKITVLPLRMKTGSGRPSRLSSVGDGYENSSAVINVAGDGGGNKKSLKQKKRKRKLKSFLARRKGRRKYKSEKNTKQVNES